MAKKQSETPDQQIKVYDKLLKAGQLSQEDYNQLVQYQKDLKSGAVQDVSGATGKGVGQKTYATIKKQQDEALKRREDKAAKLKEAKSDAEFYKQGGVGTPIQDESIFGKIKDYASRIPGNIKKEGGKALDLIKENPMMAGAAANVLGGVGGYMMGQQATDEAFKNIGRARKGYESVQQQVQGITPNQELIEARKAAIQGIKQRSEMGLTPEDQAMLRQVQAQQLRQGAASRQAAEEAATRRGAQGGQDIMAALQGAGQAQQVASEQADRLASTSFQAKQQALKDLATASQTGITGDFAQDLARAREAADIEKNIGQTYGTEAEMQGAKAAQLANLGVKAGEAVSTPLMYSALQKERMDKTPTPEQKASVVDQFNQSQARQPSAPKKDKSVAGQASSAINKAQNAANKVQKTIQQANQLGNLVGQAVGVGRAMPSTINPSSKKQAAPVPNLQDMMNIFKPKK